MDYKKLILYVALAMIVVSLWGSWQREHAGVDSSQTKQQTSASVETTSQRAPSLPEQQMPHKRSETGELIHVRTDILDVAISTTGGDIVSTKLLAYPKTLKQKSVPVQILNDNPEKVYVAQNGLLGIPGHKGKPLHYTVSQRNYQLADGQKALVVKMAWRNGSGLGVTKTFIFKRDTYAIDVGYTIKNYGASTWNGRVFSQIKRKKLQRKTGFVHLHTYTGAAISTPGDHYEKLSYKNLSEENLDRSATGGWLAMQQRYFLSAWAPGQKAHNHYYSKVNDDVYTIGVAGPEFSVPAGSQYQTSNTLYVGPEIADRLDKVADNLSLTIDYGWLWIISVAVFWVMQHIYNIVGNWGWSIILVTLLIKLLFYKLSEKSYVSMARMRNLAPRLQQLKERYGDDRQKLSQATMEIYRKEKVNPLGGCLPMLIQIPFFIGLYYVLVESVQLRQAPFILWIHDLAVKDPYYILPILMGLSMFLQQKISPAPPDPAQAKMMLFLPVVFTALFMNFPAGLVLYWLTNNVLSILQQWWIMKKFEKK